MGLVLFFLLCIYLNFQLYFCFMYSLLMNCLWLQNLSFTNNTGFTIRGSAIKCHVKVILFCYCYFLSLLLSFCSKNYTVTVHFLTLVSKYLDLRLQRQELASFASAEEMVQAVEESVRKDFSAELQSSPKSCTKQPVEPPCERRKLVISIQDKNGLNHFRVYMVCFSWFSLMLKFISYLVFLNVKYLT